MYLTTPGLFEEETPPYSEASTDKVARSTVRPPVQPRNSQIFTKPNRYLPAIKSTAILAFSSDATISMTPMDEYDSLAPQREAAFFYGLFLRGYPVDALRQDIDVPRPMLDKWLKAKDFEEAFRDNLKRVYTYRKQVLAIFDGLVLNEQNRPRVQ